MNTKRKAILFLIIVSLALYSNSLNNSFVFDDELVIVNTDFIKDMRNMTKLASKDYLRRSGELTYRPLVTLSYFIDYRLWRDDPFGFHVSNVLLHILNVIAVYFLANLLTGDLTVSLLCGLLFSTHTVNTEAVNCVAFREEMLCSFFYLSSFNLYILFRRQRKLKLYILSILAFVLSLLSKEMAMTLPFLILLYDLILRNNRQPFQGNLSPHSVSSGKLPRWRAKNFTRKLRFLLPGAEESSAPHLRQVLLFQSYCLGAYIFILMLFMHLRFNVFVSNLERATWLKLGYPGGSFYTNIINMLRVLAYYMRLLLFPHPLCPKYVFDESITIFDSRVLLALGVLIFCIFFIYVAGRKSKILLFSSLWFFICLAPVSNFVPITNIVAERYLYIPAFGFCLFSASFVLIPGSQKVRKTFISILTSLVICFGFLTLKRNPDWKDNFTLYRKTLLYFPQNYHLRYNLANLYYDSGRLREAAFEYIKIIKLNPSHTMSLNNLGSIYATIGDYPRARKCWLKSLYFEPQNLDIIRSLRKLPD